MSTTCKMCIDINIVIEMAAETHQFTELCSILFTCPLVSTYVSSGSCVIHFRNY